MYVNVSRSQRVLVIYWVVVALFLELEERKKSEWVLEKRS